MPTVSTFLRLNTASAAFAAALALAGPPAGAQTTAPQTTPQTETLPEACYRASAAQQQDRHVMAISLYNECIALSDLPPETLALILTNRAAARQHSQDFQGALRDYNEAIDLDPTRADALNGRCWAYARLRRSRQALKDCNAALELTPDDPYVLDSRALVYWLMSRDERARADLDRAHSLDPAFRPWPERFKDFERMMFGLDP